VDLWQIVRAGSSAQDVANVEKLVEYAAGKLILVRETFPDYTMHDQKHAENVVAMVEQLLGPDLNTVTPLEAAMLILAAYFHDIGMVYDPAELSALVEEEDFREFLDQNPAAYVQVRGADEIPLDVIVGYCRARHAERVSEHLFQLEPDTLAWDGVSITEGLATLCQSHNEPLDHLRSEKFSTTFLGACDLRMCAILLRLADILDFDQTRSPVAVYAHLRLANETTGSRAISNTEWSKHLASRGFRFPSPRTPNYALIALASPRQPAVEHAIRKFLDLVEEELRGCRILLDFCDQRWQSLTLPGTIDRRGIMSTGYRYGQYRFSLNRHAVLHLFTGDQLYGNPYAFIREMLQNAIDACRLNIYLHDVDPDTMEVRVSAWEDDAGNYWIRVDDTGVGMDQGIVERYYLEVGRSYYRSDELQADILRKNKSQQKFVAISRFGIGVLSSFIVGDWVEVSTRRRLPNGKLAVPLRLSLNNLDDFFVVQEHPMPPGHFPSRVGQEAGYRKSAGTSVAVRIDPTESDVTLEQLLEQARQAFFFPPVRVFINDVEQHDCRLSRLDTPLVDRVVRHPASVLQQEEGINLVATGKMTIIVVPLNLTAHSPSPAVRGQLVAITAEAEGGDSFLPALPEELRRHLPASLVRQLDTCIVTRHASVSQSSDGQLHLKLTLEFKRSVILALRNWFDDRNLRTDGFGNDLDWTAVLALETFFNNINFDDSRYAPDEDSLTLETDLPFDPRDAVGEEAARLLNRDWLGHNGIVVTTRLEGLLGGYTNLRVLRYGDFVLLGPVCLFDELRPDVFVSRDVIRGLVFPIRSALQLSIRRAAASYLTTPEHDLAKQIMQKDLLRDLPLQELTTAQIAADPLLPEWRIERLIESALNGSRSVVELRELAKNGPQDLMLPYVAWSRELNDNDYDRNWGFYETMQVAMAELELDIALKNDPEKPYSSRYEVTVRTARRPVRPPGLAVLPPFAALLYPTPDILVAPRYPANLSHPVIRWFAEHAAMLQTDYPAIFAQFKRALAMVSNLSSPMYAGETASKAAKLLNVTLNRIRHAVPVPPRELSVEVYADPERQLRSRH